jgi:hypothetical protein
METIKKRAKHVLALMAYLSTCLLLIPGTIIGQIDRKAQLESQKIAIITQKLNLSVGEAQKFWPVYNEYQQKKEEILGQRREIFEQLRGNKGNLSNNELHSISDKYLKLQAEESKLAIDYHQKFKEVLTIAKVVELYMAEEQFKFWLLGEMRRGGRGKPNDNK